MHEVSPLRLDFGAVCAKDHLMPTPLQRARAVLFLGTTNARASILAECILSATNRGAWRAYSAGSHPAATLNPHLLDFLARHDYPATGLRPKSWDEFAGEGAPALDIVITLSNDLIGVVCPVFWTGRPTSSHWPLPDDGSLEAIRAILLRRIEALSDLALDELDVVTLQMRLDAIGRS
jgi:arsenate reductase